MTATPVLRIEGLNVCYRAGRHLLPAVQRFDLELSAGEAYGLVGESGCGKSTIAFAVMGHLADNGCVTAGRILVDGEDIVGLDEPGLRRLRGAAVAMVYQDPAAALNPVMTVGRQLEEALDAHRRLTAREARTEILEVLARVRLGDPVGLLKRYPHQLSGGQLQRIVIAMALLARPRLLLLDEPTTGLDVTVEASVVTLIAELAADSGMALLYISHNLGLIARVCGRVGVMYAGQLVEEGSVRQILKAPGHPYSKALIDCLPDLRGGSRHTRLAAIPGQVPSPGTLPAGCLFAPRCAHARPCLCDVAPAPRMEALEGGHRVRCLRTREIPASQPTVAFPGRSRALPDSRLRLDGVTRVYGGDGPLWRYLGLRKDEGLRAADAVSFDIGRGETLALVGESGSGKSTLARILIGLDSATAGRALYDGRNIASLPARRRPEALIRALQIVFQNPDGTLNPSHRVHRILARALKRLGHRNRHAVNARIAELLHLVRLPAETAARFPQELSGGQRQRVAIARAFAGEPELIIADEPVSALDVSVQAAIVNLLIDVQDAAETAILLISHDLALVRHVADRVVVLYRGRVMESGSVEAVFSAPSHPYTESLLAAVHPPDPDHQPTRLAVPADGLGQDIDAAPPAEGCPFAPRCHRRIGALCFEQPPPLREVGADDHRILCHHEAAALKVPPPLSIIQKQEKSLDA
jgi:peptide/nickel transport system ATP-binding protein